MSRTSETVQIINAIFDGIVRVLHSPRQDTPTNTPPKDTSLENIAPEYTYKNPNDGFEQLKKDDLEDAQWEPEDIDDETDPNIRKCELQQKMAAVQKHRYMARRKVPKDDNFGWTPVV